MDEQKIEKVEKASEKPISDAELEQVTGGVAGFHSAAAFSAITPTTSSLLLFDEADSLFGKRTTVTDAHDRYGKP